MKKLIFIAIASVLYTACTVQNPDNNNYIPEQGKQVVETKNAVPGSIVVRFDDETADLVYEAIGGDFASREILTKAFTATKSSNSEEVLGELGAKSIERVFPNAGKWEKRHRAAGLHKWYRITFDESLPLTKAGDLLCGLQGVEYAEPEQLVQTMANTFPFNDRHTYYQWGLMNNGSKAKFKRGADINVIPVWEKYTAGSKDVIVAVVDEGVDGSHEDLQGVVIPYSEDGGSRSFVYIDKNNPVKPGSHGTHVASIFSAINNNGIGLSSVAGGYDGTGGVKVLSCEILREKEDGASGSYQGNSAEAIVYGADHGAVISQNSWGYPDASAKLSATLKDAIDYFIQYAGFDEYGKQVGPMAGGIVFFAAGNEAANNGVPASYEPVVAVGAISPDGRRASYSNYGPWVDLCAPGGEFEGSATKDWYIIGAVPEDDYLLMCGTSQACPFVSGVAALLVSHFGGPGFTNKELRSRLMYGANKTTVKSSENVGLLVDAFGAFEIGKIENPIIVSESGENIIVKSHETKEFAFTVANQKSLNVTYELEPGSKALSGSVVDSKYVIVIDAILVEPGEYTASLTASFGEDYITTISIPYTILENNPPTVKGRIPNCVVENNSMVEIDLTEYFEDADEEILNYKVTVNPTRVVNTMFTNDVLKIIPRMFCDANIEITATDARGATATISDLRFVYYDTDRGVLAYPNPVKDKLKISAGGLKSMDITISNELGKVLLEQTAEGDFFNPAEIDMSDFATGKYQLSVKYGEIESKKMIVKE